MEDEAAAVEESKVPRINQEDFDFCAGCRSPFRGTKAYVNGPSTEGSATAGDDGTNGVGEDEGGRSKRGQQGSIEAAVGEGKKIKEFYSFSVVSGELLRVTGI